MNERRFGEVNVTFYHNVCSKTTRIYRGAGQGSLEREVFPFQLNAYDSGNLCKRIKSDEAVDRTRRLEHRKCRIRLIKLGILIDRDGKSPTFDPRGRCFVLSRP